MKNLIRANTTRDQAQAIAIPGQADTALQQFEESFFNELSNQHDRVDLFVKSKSDEIGRRLRGYLRSMYSSTANAPLEHLQKCVVRLLARCAYNNADGKAIGPKKREKFAKYDLQIEKCGADIRSLQRFVGAQRIAFHKILKKYKVRRYFCKP